MKVGWKWDEVGYQNYTNMLIGEYLHTLDDKKRLSLPAKFRKEVGKKVVVRFSPKNPNLNDLELDSWTYTGDRPTSLSI